MQMDWPEKRETERTQSVESLEWSNSDGPTNYRHYTKAGRTN